MNKRRALHSGTWYVSDAQVLQESLSLWLSRACSSLESFPSRNYDQLKCIIGPHAGYSYSGPAAAWAYYPLMQRLKNGSEIRRIIILGPSHHVYLEKCGLTEFDALETPFGELRVDTDTRDNLLCDHSDLFMSFPGHHDEEEHSLEMHMPYIAHLLSSIKPKNSQSNVQTGLDTIKILPIVVGAITKSMEFKIGEALKSLIAQDDTLIVVSSDFCHWGSRFGYQPRRSSQFDDISEDIEDMDREAMNIIERCDIDEFHRYLRRTKNTICGRHPIGVLLNALKVIPCIFSVRTDEIALDDKSSDAYEDTNPRKCHIRFVHYSQSNRCKSLRDSSVSYASALIYIE